MFVKLGSQIPQPSGVVRPPFFTSFILTGSLEIIALIVVCGTRVIFGGFGYRADSTEWELVLED